jgi:copper chaperone
MQHCLLVENIKCGGCAHSILSKLSMLEGVDAVQVDVEQGAVCFESASDQLQQVKTKLADMGYPEQGTLEGLSSVGAKAKSFVSCAIGKMTKD